MTPEDYRSLSELLSGELNDRQAAELHKRIEAHADLAEAWQLMQAIPGALATLPQPDLPQKWALEAITRSRGPHGSRRWWTGWLVAAASLLTHLIPATPNVGLPEEVATHQAVATPASIHAAPPQSPLFPSEHPPTVAPSAFQPALTDATVALGAFRRTADLHSMLNPHPSSREGLENLEVSVPRRRRSPP